MPARSATQHGPNTWLVLNDFTPGIQQRTLHAGGPVSPHPQLGSATENTFRCIALPGGGLGPLPKRSISYSIASIEGNANIGNVANGRYTICGFHVAGPILASPAPGIDACEFHLAFEYIYSGVRRYRWQRHRMWESTPGVDLIVSINSAEASPATSMRPTFFHNYRSHNTDATQPGNPQVVGAWYAGGGANEKVWKIYPDPAAPGANGTYDISTTLAIEHAVGHQGRAVGFNQIPWSHGTPGTWSFNEQIFFTLSNLKTLQSTVAQVFGQENATGYSVVGSLSASEFILLKAQGGAYLVRSDIAAPTVLRLPGVISPGNARHQGCSTPIGFVYGVRDGGVWVWNGGESADCISAQLETDFWQGQPGTDFLDYQGRFELFHEWVLAPNNWLYDFARKSWWKIEDPSVAKIMQWSMSVINPRVYGAVASYVDSTTPIVYGFDKATPATSYQWESQPIPQSMDHVVQVRELVCVIQGAGTVAITVTASDGTTLSETFTNTTATPTAQRANFNLQGSHLQVKIVADHGSSAAPIVHEVRLGIHDEKRLLPAV